MNNFNLKFLKYALFLEIEFGVDTLAVKSQMTNTLLFDNQSKDTKVRSHISKKHKGKSAKTTSTVRSCLLP